MPKAATTKKTPSKTPSKAPKAKSVKTPTLVVQKPAAKPTVPQYFYAAGKRKTSIARVRLFKKTSSGNPVIEVNTRPFEKYFPMAVQQQIIASPLKITDQFSQFDVTVLVEGGGPMSQAEAVRHGVSRALLEYNPALRLTLKRAGYLTRDSRIKERKKYGLHRARRGPQFSKR